MMKIFYGLIGSILMLLFLVSVGFGQVLDQTIPVSSSQEVINTSTNTPRPTTTPFLPVTPTSTATPEIPTPTFTPEVVLPSAELWKDWPIIPPKISPELKDIFQQGIELGNNPNAFSILGDCQSQPNVFMGLYDRNPSIVLALDRELQETVAQFSGSFDRYSPTVKDGTTEGALLWPLWNENREGKCTPNESPIDCELRVHKPVIAFIHVGTHWETRNEEYLTRIIEKLLENHTIPIMVTKADNREFDERINATIVKLAEVYNLPVWNFWASVQELPNHGLRYGQNMYLSTAGVEVHRTGALEVLDYVWRELSNP